MATLHPLARRRMVDRLGAAVFAAGLTFAVAACSSADTADVGSDVGSGVGSTESALTGSAAVSRAEQWANAALPYCQSPYGQIDPDDSCWSQPWESGHRCYRTSNAAWNPYRSDCSGLVSWAWALPAPGRTTYGFAPFQTDITHAISASALQPGDAVNNNDHVMLFKAWVTPGARAIFIEEPGCSTAIKHARELTSNVSTSGTSIHVDDVGMTFTAIRYAGIGAGGGGGGGSGSSGGGATGGCAVGGLYCGGDKVSGHASTLYRCTGGSAGVEIAACADGCEVRAGQDDACRGTGACVVGGEYCGGDKVTGDPRTLYRCTGGSNSTVVAHCANGCAVRAGANDVCR